MTGALGGLRSSFLEEESLGLASDNAAGGTMATLADGDGGPSLGVGNDGDGLFCPNLVSSGVLSLELLL